MPFTTYVPKASEIQRKWLLYDAEGLILGRLAVEVASKLIGKHKAICTRHLDVGDSVIIINAEKVALTGNKLQDKIFYWHTGYPGGIKQKNARTILSGHSPAQLIELAVKSMLGRGPMARQRMRNLKVYCGGSHPHVAQAPEFCNFASMNKKNVVRLA